MKSKGNKLAKILREMRIERGLSLRQFSSRLGISHAYLDKLEKGTDGRTGKVISPTVDILCKLAQNANIPTKKFFKMCGYFEDTHLVLQETGSSKVCDITDDFEDIKAAIITSEIVVHNDKPLSEEKVAQVMNHLDAILHILKTKCVKLKT